MQGYSTALSEKAQSDIINIYLYIEQRNPVAAEAITDKLRVATETLREQPRMGALRTDIGKGIRHLVVGNYLILYRVEDETVQVLRYLHGARNLSDTV